MTKGPVFLNVLWRAKGEEQLSFMTRAEAELRMFMLEKEQGHMIVKMEIEQRQ